MVILNFCCCFLNESEEFVFSAALNVFYHISESSFSFIKLHLPRDSAKAKEGQIVAIDRYLYLQKDQVNYFI